MDRDIVLQTFEELKSLGIRARLSNVLVTRSTTLDTPWTFSYVVHDDGYTACGAGNNCFDIPFDITFIEDLLGLDVYEAAERVAQRGRSAFNNSLLISLATALSSREMMDEEFLRARGFEVRVVPQPAIGSVVEQGLVTSSDVVAIVGYFYAFVARIARVARQVNVTELSPSSDFDLYECKPATSNVRVFPASQNRDILRHADVVIMTGQTLVNDTALELLGYAQNARLVMMQGPTCSFYPQALFEAGVDAVGTTHFPGDDRFHDLLVNSRAYWYSERDLKHMLIMRKTGEAAAGGAEAQTTERLLPTPRET